MAFCIRWRDKRLELCSNWLVAFQLNVFECMTFCNVMSECAWFQQEDNAGGIEDHLLGNRNCWLDKWKFLMPDRWTVSNQCSFRILFLSYWLVLDTRRPWELFWQSWLWECLNVNVALVHSRKCPTTAIVFQPVWSENRMQGTQLELNSEFPNCSKLPDDICKSIFATCFLRYLCIAPQSKKGAWTIPDCSPESMKPREFCLDGRSQTIKTMESTKQFCPLQLARSTLFVEAGSCSSAIVCMVSCGWVMVKHVAWTKHHLHLPRLPSHNPKFQANVNGTLYVINDFNVTAVTAIRNNYMTRSKPLSQAVDSQRPPQVQSPIHGQGMCTGQSDQSQNSKSLQRIQNFCVTHIDASLLNLAH